MGGIGAVIEGCCEGLLRRTLERDCCEGLSRVVLKEAQEWPHGGLRTLLPCQHYSRAMRVLEAARGVPHVTGMLAQLVRPCTMRTLGEDLQFKESR